jgi:Trk-type K+ transport system membrane component
MVEPPDYEPFNPNNPYTQVLLLAQRVETLGREKEALERREDELEKRMSKMEASFNRGAGILMVLPIVGTVVGLLFAYGKAIFKPWAGTP